MSGTRGGVALDIRTTAEGAKENLEEIGAAGAAALQRVADAAKPAAEATAAVSAEVAKVPAALAPAAAATATLTEKTQQLTAAQQGNVVSMRSVVASRQQHAAAIQVETAALNTQASAAQRLTTVATGVAGNIGTLVDLGTQLAASSGAVSTLASTVAGFLGGLGVPGAAAAAALGVVAVAAGRIEASAERADAASKAAFESMELGGRNAAGVIDQVAEAFANAARNAGQLAAAQRDALAQTVQVQQRQLAALRESQQLALDAARERVAQLDQEAVTDDALAAQRQRQYGGRRASGGTAPNSASLSATVEDFRARNEVAGLNRDLERTDQLLAQAAQAAQQLTENLPNPPDEPPGAPAREAARAATVRLTDAEREYQQVMNQAEAQITRTMTAEEQRTQTIERLTTLKNEGKISEDQLREAIAETGRALEATRGQEARRAAERASDKAARDAERAAQQVQQANQQATDSIVRYGAEQFATLFDKNKDGWKGMLQTFESTAKSTIGRIAAELILRPIISPIVNSLGLGTIATRSGLSGLGGLGLGGDSSAVAAASGGSGVMGQAGNLSSSQTVLNGFRGLNPGDYISGSTAYNTGFGFVDNTLNTSLWGVNAATQASATNSAIGAMGGGLYGPATGEAVAAAGGSATGVGGTIGSVGAGALGVAGGLYGLYSGVQRGGVGGYTSAAGGAAAAGLSAAAMAGLSVPVYGWIAAAVLSIVGALLPGEKASGKGQEFRVDLLSGNTDANGLTGSRYSGQNASQAESAARSISTLAGQLGTALGNARIPGEAAVGVTSSRGEGPGQLYLEVSGRKAQFQNSEEGAQQLADQAAKFLLEAFRGAVSGDFVGILNASPTVEKLQENLDWYTQVYKSFDTTTVAASQFQQALDALNKSFGDTYQKASDLGLATDNIGAAWDKAKADQEQQRNLQLSGYDIGLTIRSLQATGGDSSAIMQQVALMQFDLAAKQQLDQAKSTLEGLGLASDDVASRIARNEQVLAEERLAIQKQYGDASLGLAQGTLQQQLDALTVLKNQSGVLSSFLDQQAVGGLGVSPQQSLMAAQQLFGDAVGAARGAGPRDADLGAVTSAAQALLQSGSAYYGAGREGSLLRQSVLGQVQQLGASLDLPRFGADLERGMTRATAPMVDALTATQNELASLKAELTRLTEQVRGYKIAVGG